MNSVWPTGCKPCAAWSAARAASRADGAEPAGKIPTLVLEDGTVIFDSPVICAYLDTLHDGPKLFPPWPQRLTALRRLALGDGMLDVALAWLGERLRPRERQSAPHIELWRGKIRLPGCAGERGRSAGGRPVHDRPYRDRGGAGVSRFPFHVDCVAENRPRLAQWQAGFDQRPSVRANLPVDDR